MRIGGTMRHKHMSKRDYRAYKQAYRDYVDDLQREHGAWFRYID